MSQITTPAILPRIPEVVELALSEIQTDMPVKTALQLAGQLKDMKLSSVRFFTMPGSPAYIGGISYFVPDLQQASEEMDPNFGYSAKKPASDDANVRKKEPLPEPASDQNLPEEGLTALASRFKAPIAVLNGTGKAGLGKKFTSLFEQAGIEVAFTGNAKHADFRYCLIQYSDKGSLQMAKDLARLCGISEKLIRKTNIPYPVALILGKINNGEVAERLQTLLAKQ